MLVVSNEASSNVAWVPDLNDVYIVMIYHHGLCWKEPVCIDFVVRETTSMDFFILEDMSIY